jgi:hypothetical protein
VLLLRIFTLVPRAFDPRRHIDLSVTRIIANNEANNETTRGEFDMLGFVLGALCVVAAARVMRRGWMWHHGGRFCQPFAHPFAGRFGDYGPGYGRSGCSGFGRFGRFRDGYGLDRDRWAGDGHGDGAPGAGIWNGFDGPRRWFLRGLFERLETTPGQEKAILLALDRLRDERRQVFDELRQSRVAVAHVIEGGLVDDAALEETFARHDRVLARARVSFVEALKTVTEALDERQRKELASLIASRRFFGG